MKLASCIEGGKIQLGLVSEGQIINLTAAADNAKENHLSGIPVEAFADLTSLLTWMNGQGEVVQEIAVWAGGEGADPYRSNLDEVEFAVPIANPGKIICVGLNYADHCRETKTSIPASPILFNKFNSSLLAHGGEITWASESTEQVDFEAELAVIVGRKARHVSQAEAMDYVGAYTMVNDISARDVQFSDGQWLRGKSFDTFCPMGPLVVTANDISDPHNLPIMCRVNGRTLQDSNTAEMIFKIPYLIEFISSFCTLYPGDIISTGTPHGVGAFRDPKIFLGSGDVVEVEIEGIGVLRNTVA